MDEKLLIEKLKKKDEEAFKELFRLYADSIYNTALGLLQNQPEAEDMVQETLIEVLRSIATFKENAAIKSWIYRITVSKCLDFIKSKKRLKRGGVFSFISFSNSEDWMHQPDFNHPSVQLENKEMAATLFKAINQLPENQKVAYTLNKVEDLPYKEVADIMKTSVSSVESLLNRAKKNLKKLLEDYYKNHF